MKMLLIVLLLVPLVSFGKTAEEYNNIGIEKDDLGDLSSFSETWFINSDGLLF
jgi:hypothetical protein